MLTIPKRSSLEKAPDSTRGSLQGKKSVSKNILTLALFRGGNVAIQLLLVPISINYVSAEYYGLWLTISSMITWLNIMDFGLSNGLRNKLAISKMQDNVALSKKYISTTYAILFYIALIGIVASTASSYLINWNNLLDIPSNFSKESFLTLITIVIVSFFLTFLLKPISAVAYSFHQPFVEPMLSCVSSAVNLVLILILQHLDNSGNIIHLGLVFCLSPIVVNAAISFVLFRTQFREYSPSIKYIDMTEAKPLMSLSGKFFVIQIAATLVLTTTNFIISHYFGNKAVTEYNIVQRYFSVVLILQGMILAPFWNLITEAYTGKQPDWLQSTMKKLLLMTLGFSAMIIVMIIVSPFVLKLWIGDSVDIPLSLTISFGLYTIVFLYGTLFTTFINGTGKVKLQMTTSVFTCLFYIPFVILLVKFFNIGTLGIVIASTIWTVVILPFRYIQYRKLLDFSGQRSIWNS
jgi:O-antigen/teichoic acid export membrane protein